MDLVSACWNASPDTIPSIRAEPKVQARTWYLSSFLPRH